MKIHFSMLPDYKAMLIAESSQYVYGILFNKDNIIAAYINQEIIPLSVNNKYINELYVTYAQYQALFSAILDCTIPQELFNCYFWRIKDILKDINI